MEIPSCRNILLATERCDARGGLTKSLGYLSNTPITPINLCALSAASGWTGCGLKFRPSLLYHLFLLKCLLSLAGKLLNGRQHLLEFKPVGDHQTPGGDFRIRSAVLWLKVTSQGDTAAATSTTTSSGGNITIWIFNMKTSGPWENKSDGCPAQNEEKVDSNRNCPSSELSRDDAPRNRVDVDATEELNLNEKVRSVSFPRFFSTSLLPLLFLFFSPDLFD